MISTVFIQPVDMVKVRIQLGEKGNPVSGGRALSSPKPLEVVRSWLRHSTVAVCCRMAAMWLFGSLRHW